MDSYRADTTPSARAPGKLERTASERHRRGRPRQVRGLSAGKTRARSEHLAAFAGSKKLFFLPGVWSTDSGDVRGVSESAGTPAVGGTGRKQRAEYQSVRGREKVMFCPVFWHSSNSARLLASILFAHDNTIYCSLQCEDACKDRARQK